MNKIIIPSKFQLGAHTITVEINNESLLCDDLYGKATFPTNKIELATKVNLNCKQTSISRSKIEHTFFHELTHQILHSMNKSELNRDEEFVDNFANFLLQFLQTADYKNPVK